MTFNDQTQPDAGANLTGPNGFDKLLWSRCIAALLISSAIVWAYFHFVVLQSMRGYDSFWHLAIGRLISETGEVPRVDPFCYTTAGLPWTNINWLAQLLFYRAFEAYGFAGSLHMVSVLYAAVIFAFFLQARAKCARTLVMLFFLPFLAYELFVVVSLRPRMFSFALFAVVVWLLSRRDEKHRFSWGRALCLLPLYWLWNNLHGGVIYGYGLLVLDAAGATIDSLLQRRRLITRRAVLLAGVGLFGSAGFLFHPLGLDAPQYILRYRTQLNQPMYENIVELLPFGLSSSYGQIAAVYVVLATAGIILSRRRPLFRELLPAAVFLFATMRIQRFIPALVIVSLPMVLSAWSEVISRSRSRLLQWAEEVLAYTPAMLAGMMALMLAVWTVWIMPERYRGERPGTVDHWLISPERYPVEQVKYLQSHPRPKRIFNEYAYGGFLDWALYPARRTFIDGRGDLHSSGPGFAHYMTIVNEEPGWLDRFTSYRIGYALLPRNHPLAATLQTSHNWLPRLSTKNHTLLQHPSEPLPSPR